MGNTKVWIAILFLFISLGIVGIQSGWFSEVTINERENIGWVMTGVEYEGKLNNNEFMLLYDSISNEINKGELKGNLAALFFSNPNSEGVVKVMIGAIDTAPQKVGEYKLYNQNSYKELFAEINLGELLTPNPSNIIDKLSETADKEYPNQEKLYLEYYPNNKSVIQSVILQK